MLGAIDFASERGSGGGTAPSLSPSPSPSPPLSLSLSLSLSAPPHSSHDDFSFPRPPFHPAGQQQQQQQHVSAPQWQPAAGCAVDSAPKRVSSDAFYLARSQANGQMDTAGCQNGHGPASKLQTYNIVPRFQHRVRHRDLRCVLHPSTLGFWVQNTSRIHYKNVFPISFMIGFQAGTVVQHAFRVETAAQNPADFFRQQAQRDMQAAKSQMKVGRAAWWHCRNLRCTHTHTHTQHVHTARTRARAHTRAHTLRCTLAGGYTVQSACCSVCGRVDVTLLLGAGRK